MAHVGRILSLPLSEVSALALGLSVCLSDTLSQEPVSLLVPDSRVY